MIATGGGAAVTSVDQRELDMQPVQQHCGKSRSTLVAAAARSLKR